MHLAPDKITMPACQFFTGRMPFLPPNQQRSKHWKLKHKLGLYMKIFFSLSPIGQRIHSDTIQLKFSTASHTYKYRGCNRRVNYLIQRFVSSHITNININACLWQLPTAFGQCQVPYHIIDTYVSFMRICDRRIFAYCCTFGIFQQSAHIAYFFPHKLAFSTAILT